MKNKTTFGNNVPLRPEGRSIPKELAGFAGKPPLRPGRHSSPALKGMRLSDVFDNKGLSLIELLIVVAILGILVGSATYAYLGQQRRAAYTEAKTNLETLRLLEEQFFAENGRYTVSLGAPGKDHPGNVNIIKTGGGNPFEALPGFKPPMKSDGITPALSFSYWIEQNVRVNGVAQQNCFRASAEGNSNTNVEGIIFRIDCENNRENF